MSIKLTFEVHEIDQRCPSNCRSMPITCAIEVHRIDNRCPSNWQLMSIIWISISIKLTCDVQQIHCRCPLNGLSMYMNLTNDCFQESMIILELITFHLRWNTFRPNNGKERIMFCSFVLPLHWTDAMLWVNFFENSNFSIALYLCMFQFYIILQMYLIFIVLFKVGWFI